jgi:hypothetical protein
MKFLLVASMLVGSVFANASDGWSIKCFEKGHHGPDLAYLINVDYPLVSELDRRIELYDCRKGSDAADPKCEERGHLRKVERQEENCLVLARREGESVDRGWTLCHEKQDTVTNPPGLVPVTVTDDYQDSRVYCERELLKIL